MATPLRILIVEDSADDADLVVLELSRAGVAPAWRRVDGPDEMRAALAVGPWDAVLWDITLRGFGAVQALALCRECDPFLPFIVVSGTIGEQQAVEVMRAGAADYLLKGNLTRLPAAVERQVREATSRRSRSQAELATQRLAAVVESSQDAILCTDLDGRIESWNGAAERLFGNTFAEVAGRADVITPPQLVAEARDREERLARGQHVPPFESVGVRKGGELVAVSVTLSSLRVEGRVVSRSAIYRDITEQKRASLALRSSEVRYRRLFEAAKDGILILDADTARITDANGFICELLGFSHAELLGKELWEIGLFRDIDANKVALRELQERAYIRYADHPLLTKDGRQVEVEFVSNVYDVGGASVIQCNIRDITDRKRSDEALRRSEERYRTLIAATTAIVWDTPASGEFDSEQPGWTAFTGQAVSQHRGRGWLDAVHPADREDSLRAWTRAVAGGTSYQVEHRLRRADGEYRTMSVRAVPILDPGGAVREWVGVHTDVTDQKRAEADLRMRDRAIQEATQGLVITDPSQPGNPCVYVSPGFERMTGYPACEALGRNPRFLQGPETNAAVAARLQEAVRAGVPCTVELLNYRKDGTSYWNEVSVSPVRDSGGRLTHFVGVQMDVTARRSLEDQYRQAQKMEAVGQLAGGIAHDFNNLLCIINGYSDLLLRGLPPDHPSFRFLTEIRSAGERSASLTRQLLVFSRKQIISPTVLDLNSVVTDAETLLRRVIGEDVRLASSLGGGLGRVRADEGQLQQVLMNLVINARDAMPRGGRLTIETRNVELDEGYSSTHAHVSRGPYVLLAVSDTGCGMTAQVKERIFEPFFTTKSVGEGTGLGLAVVHGVVKQSGGHVEVYSEVGRGTTFKVYLPRVEQPAQPAEPHSAVLRPPRGTETVMVVEDEDAVRALTCRLLAGCGYDVLEAEDGERALRAAGRHDGPIHLLVTDVVMPGLSGREVAERLLGLHPGLAVLYVSGYTDDAVMRHGVLEQQAVFLQKPFSLLALAVKVREVLDAPRARLERLDGRARPYPG